MDRRSAQFSVYLVLAGCSSKYTLERSEENLHPNRNVVTGWSDCPDRQVFHRGIEVLKAVKAALPKEIPVGVRISQGKVNDFTSKWAGGEADAAVVFSALAQAGADFIHVTEFEAWKPAFKNGNASLVELARKYAPHVALIANGGLHDNERATQVLAQGSDILALGRGALSNPDLPQMLEKQQALRPFDPSVLSPVANIKDSELSFG